LTSLKAVTPNASANNGQNEPEHAEQTRQRQSQANQILECRLALYRDAKNGKGWGDTIDAFDNTKKVPTAAMEYRMWLAGRYFEKYGSMPGDKPLRSAHDMADHLARRSRQTYAPPPDFDASNVGGDTGDEKQADVLIKLALGRVELFNSGDADKYSVFADIKRDGYIETLSLHSRSFRLFLTKLYRDTFLQAPGKDALTTAAEALSAIAYFDGPQRDIHVRVAGGEHASYIDLGDEKWTVLKAASEGWGVVADAPVRFRHPSKQRPLPMPVQPAQGTDSIVTLLKRHINAKEDEDLYMIVGWLIAALRGYGDLPVLVFNGPQGSCKSTASRMVRTLVDPNEMLLRLPPSEPRDLHVAGRNSWVMGYDQITTVPLWWSNAMCVMSGDDGGFATRQLYSDGDEMVFTAKRPCILAGIPEFVSQPDLADRSVFVRLARPKRRLRGPKLMQAFEKDVPLILGSLLDLVANGFRNIGAVEAEDIEWPRMAEFAAFVEAASRGDQGFVPEDGQWLTAYRDNRKNAVREVVENDQVAKALCDIAETLGEEYWQGTAGELFERVKDQVGESVAKSAGFPKSARGFTAHVDGLATFLEQVGVIAERTSKRAARGHGWRVYKKPDGEES
jgi:hypothetical protein